VREKNQKIGALIIFLKKEQSRLRNYVEIALICLLLGVLTFIFDWPKHIYIVLGFGFLINLVAVEILKKDT